jgi:hypothetical protein
VTNNGVAPVDPTCSTGTVGNSFTLIQDPTWIKVIACKAGHAASAVLDAGNYAVSGIAAPTFSPAGPNLPNDQSVNVTTISSGVPGSVMCYTTGNVAGANPAANPTCSPTNNGCTTGTVVSPASTGVSLPINPPPGQHTFIKAITCGGTAGVNSTVVEQDFFLKPSDAVISPTTGSNFTAPVAATITLAPPPDCYGAGTCTGASQTVSPTICYTLDNTTVSFDPTNCAPSAGSTTTCTATTQVNLPIDSTTIVRAATCKAGYSPGSEQQRTLSFANYSRAITGSAADMLGGVTPAPGDGKFLNAENLLATTDPAYSFYLSWTSNPLPNGLTTGNVYFGLKGLDLGVNNTTHVTSFYINDPSQIGPALSTLTPNTAVSHSSTPLPTRAIGHIACVNNATVDVVDCELYGWDSLSSTWVLEATGLTFSRSTALEQLLVGFDFGTARRLVVFGAINVSGTDVVGFPGAGAPYQHWVDVALQSYRSPNDSIYFH